MRRRSSNVNSLMQIVSQDRTGRGVAESAGEKNISNFFDKVSRGLCDPHDRQ